MLISLSNVSNLPQFYFQPILAAIFATIATVKVELMLDLYTWVTVLL